ncbi:MAG: hypothetical protein EA409_01130 [Saprospirales bacterium]|nr:MAG: hypothetical protein EA409_01130 [Saprospirales bacterium]
MMTYFMVAEVLCPWIYLKSTKVTNGGMMRKVYPGTLIQATGNSFVPRTPKFHSNVYPGSNIIFGDTDTVY